MDLSLRYLCLLTVSHLFLLVSMSQGQMLSGLAGGRIPKGAERDLKPWLTLGNKNTNKDLPTSIDGHWTGFEADHFVSDAVASFTSDGSNNWSSFYGLRFDIIVGEGESFAGTIELTTPKLEAKSSYRTTAPITTTARFTLLGTGKLETIDLPFSAFDHW
ncbi:MAG: hypothetical protein AAF514_11820 [Verrucomicrobiota bacterium]